VTKLEVRRSIAGCDEYVRALVEQRVYPKPFARIRFVAPVELTFPAPPRPPMAGAPVKYRSVPPNFLQLASGEPPRLPDAFKAKHLGETFRGGYMVYVEANGRVSRVEVVQSVPECDEHIMAGLRTWKYVAPKEPIRSIVQISWSLNLNPRP
jgi:hypothetical protein